MELTHLCFADDLLVVCKLEDESIKAIKAPLDEFSSYSGLLPNEGKSTIFFGSVEQEEQDQIIEVIKFKKWRLLVKYLGVPLISKQLGVKDWKGLIDKVRTRILSWKNKNLTYVARLQLISSMLA